MTSKLKAIQASLNRYDVATFIVALFHVSGCIGMFTSKREWFVANTPLNLLIVFGLIIFTQKQRNLGFFIFLVLAFVTGMVVEMVGVNTGLLFGDYAYGNVLGPGINSVPWLIGINWFVVVYCSGVITYLFHNKITSVYRSNNRVPSNALLTFTFIFDAALLATFYDWVMEPVAIKLGYWTWQLNEVPFFNYGCWFIISSLLLVVFRLLRFDKENHFAVHLFIIQLLFFGVLRTFL